MIVGSQSFCMPDIGASWAFGQVPVVSKQQVEIAHIPFDWVGGPGAFDPACGGMNANTAFKIVFPAEALLDDASPFRLCTDKLWITRTMCFAEGMATSHQGDSFFIVHGHTCKGFADIYTGTQRIWVPVWAFWIDINQAHLYGGQWIFQIALTAVTIVVQPSVFCAPIDIFFRLPNIDATAAKAKGFETHRLEGHISGQDHQISP